MTTSHLCQQPDSGFALVLTLLLTMLLSALGLSTLLMIDVDVLSAANHRDAAVVRHAAEAAAHLAVHELARRPDWSPALSGGAAPLFAGALSLPPAAGGSPIDLSALTADLQRESHGSLALGADTPQWRSLGYGVTGTEVPLSGLPADVYTILWISDDVVEADGDPQADDNGVVVVRARAIGVRRSEADVQVVIARTSTPGVVRLVSSRLVR